jgi:hypothetical protein
MPVVSRFDGITIYLNYEDHNPPHFHARYGEEEILVEIQSGTVTGTLSRRALRLVLEWLELHRDELMADWLRARDRKPLIPIPPLD